MDPNNQLEIDKPGGINTCSFEKNNIPRQIEMCGLLRYSKVNIEISNSHILGIYNRIENRNERPCYQHSE